MVRTRRMEVSRNEILAASRDVLETGLQSCHCLRAWIEPFARSNARAEGVDIPTVRSTR